MTMPRNEGEALPGRARDVALRDPGKGGEHRAKGGERQTKGRERRQEGGEHRQEGGERQGKGRERRVRRDDGGAAHRSRARKGGRGQAAVPSSPPSGASARPGDVRELARRWCDDNMNWDGVLWRSCHAYIERRTTM
ncbi:hypothetical protein HTZ77_17160 [Nonomuraea sp. SMC257]|uniref:Uncharacterized protein n=1 Tax=Nonomuraea montanisoli TaxID=2741721 RepID=A0A7Y6I7J5_9ACTN|nr:hypothetical protein [Nonomuraea montanisoli]NUW33147.1 hypothetical protein [Nonomuraea montanisoli]